MTIDATSFLATRLAIRIYFMACSQRLVMLGLVMSGSHRLCFRSSDDSTSPLEVRSGAVTASYDRLLAMGQILSCLDDVRGWRGGDAG